MFLQKMMFHTNTHIYSCLRSYITEYSWDKYVVYIYLKSLERLKLLWYCICSAARGLINHMLFESAKLTGGKVSQRS